jgi:Protein of unknown function DUF262
MPDNTNEVTPVELINAVDSRLKKVHTQSLDISFNELLDMRKNGELDISPDFQRLFQWSEGARSRFIESLLLEMPVPPIYVIEEEEGKYLLIDGLQRISSYLHLRGELEADHLDPPVFKGQKLEFIDCDIIKELNGKTYDNLGTALQIKLKRSFVRVEVVRKGSDPQFKYHMFKRLNTGGQLLTQQQLRNCTIRLLNPKFANLIIDLSKDDHFKECIANITQEAILGAFDQELVLRFFSFKNNRDNFKHDVADFMTEYMEKVTEDSSGANFNYDAEKNIFLKTFSVLKDSLGEVVFCRANNNLTKISKSFSVYHFEAITLGIQSCLDRVSLEDKTSIEKLTDGLSAIKYDQAFVDLTTGGGKNSPGPLRARIAFVENKLGEFL